MKRLIQSVLVSGLVLMLVGCHSGTMPNNRPGVVSNNQSVNDVLEAQTADTPQPQETPEAVTEPEPQESGIVYDTVDVDLTQSSDTMLYSEVIMMADEMDSYLGKTVKIHGEYMYYHDDMSEYYYPSVIVLDATKCCATGLVFQLAEGDVYPEEGEQITVTGVYDTYLTSDSPFLTLKNAVVTIDKS